MQSPVFAMVWEILMPLAAALLLLEANLTECADVLHPFAPFPKHDPFFQKQLVIDACLVQAVQSGQDDYCSILFGDICIRCRYLCCLCPAGAEARS